MSFFSIQSCRRSFSVISFLVFTTTFGFNSFAQDLETLESNRTEALASQIVSEQDGIHTLDFVIMEYQKSKFYSRKIFADLQMTHYKVGHVVRLFENGLAEVIWSSKDGVPVSESQSDYVKAKNLSPQVFNYDSLHSGNGVNFSSKYARNPLSFEGTVKRAFANGQIEVEWYTGGKNQKYVSTSYWTANQLKPEPARQGYFGSQVVYLDPARVYMALSSFERGLKDVGPDYLSLLDQLVLSRADSICRISGFVGLAMRPEVMVKDHHQVLEAYLPVRGELSPLEFKRTRGWSWSHIRQRSSNGALVGIGVGSIGTVLVGLALVPFTAGGSVIIALGGYAGLLGAFGLERVSQGFQGHLSYRRVLERHEAGKPILSDIALLGGKISPLVFKEIRCAVNPQDLLNFDFSWIHNSENTEISASPSETPIQEVDLIDFDTVL